MRWSLRVVSAILSATSIKIARWLSSARVSSSRTAWKYLSRALDDEDMDFLSAVLIFIGQLGLKDIAITAVERFDLLKWPAKLIKGRAIHVQHRSVLGETEQACLW